MDHRLKFKHWSKLALIIFNPYLLSSLLSCHSYTCVLLFRTAYYSINETRPVSLQVFTYDIPSAQMVSRSFFFLPIFYLEKFSNIQKSRKNFTVNVRIVSHHLDSTISILSYLLYHKSVTLFIGKFLFVFQDSALKSLILENHSLIPTVIDY